MTVRISSTKRVACRATIELPLSATSVWGQLRDFRSAAMHDAFHAEIQVEGGVPRSGARISLLHQHLFWRSTRIGRILLWQEGSGFAFSDLCETDRGKAFPHVVRYRLRPVSQDSCQLLIFVGGRWTHQSPNWMGRIWLWWVFSQMVHSVTNEILRFAVAKKLLRKSVKIS
jgi:hypothetical protein